MRRLGIMVLAYNVAPTLADVLQRIPPAVLGRAEEVLVLDNASQDDTSRVAHAFKAAHGWNKLTIVRNPTNLGYGGNQQRGYRHFIERGVEIAVMLHGDGQYAPEVMGRLIEPLDADRADLVMGSRMLVPGAALKGRMPLYKYVGNHILTAGQNWLLGTRLSEFHSGYRAYRTDVLARLPFERLSSDFQFDTEIILELLRHHHRILEVPIPTHYGDEVCNVNGLAYAWQCFRATAAFAVATGRWPRVPGSRRRAARRPGVHPSARRRAR